jgi:alkylation response protein AidB-like acyl-CoA dehydrogenase
LDLGGSRRSLEFGDPEMQRKEPVDTRPVYTLKSTPAVIESHDEAVERARALKDRLRARIDLGQELRRLPDENVADILESGLYGVMKPKRYGGSELGTETMIDVTIELASADPSTGWVYMLWAAHMWMQSLWPVAGMDEMWENPNGLASSVVTTTGDVVPVDGGYRWTGKGLFSSGVDHCNWLTAAVPMKFGESTERLWLLIPREDFEIVDDWYTIGLRGTGSKTIVLDDVFIPDHRTLRSSLVDAGMAPGREVNTHPMYGAVSNANFTGAMSAPAIGAAKGLVETIQAKMASKVQTITGTNNPYVAEGLSTNMARFAHAAAQVDAAHALLLIDAQQFARVPAKDVTVEERQRLRRNSTFTAQQARRAANLLFEEAGGGGLLESSPIQRIWRDTNGAAAHHGLTWDWQGDSWTRAGLGLTVGQGFG